MSASLYGFAVFENARPLKNSPSYFFVDAHLYTGGPIDVVACLRLYNKQSVNLNQEEAWAYIVEASVRLNGFSTMLYIVNTKHLIGRQISGRHGPTVRYSISRRL